MNTRTTPAQKRQVLLSELAHWLTRDGFVGHSARTMDAAERAARLADETALARFARGWAIHFRRNTTRPGV